jgi:type III pantothenate kinase
MIENNIQIGLSIGNSRYHWAWFVDTQLQSCWDSEYLTINQLFNQLPIDLLAIIKTRALTLATIPIYLVSVVPAQTEIWQKLAQVKIITLADIPLNNLYPTLGIDRALSILGAGDIYGYPVLVIDGGTALTITGIDEQRWLIGGAILPGLRLQLRSLAMGTAALPAIELPAQLPPRWSDNTPDSIASGILHTVTAGIKDFIQDWQRLYPDSQIIFTGGDGEILHQYLSADLITKTRFDRQLLFHGLVAILSRL